MNKATRNLNLYIQSKTEEIYELCLDCAKNEKHVVLLTNVPCNIIPLLAGREMTKDMLQLIEIIYFPHMADLVKKIRQLHDSADIPTIMIVDLCNFVINYHQLNLQRQQQSNIEYGYSNTSLFHTLSFCLAAILNLSNWAESEKTTSNLENVKLLIKPNKWTILFTLPENSDTIPHHHLQTLRNLYFYHENAVLNDLEKLRNHILGVR